MDIVNMAKDAPIVQPDTAPKLGAALVSWRT